MKHTVKRAACAALGALMIGAAVPAYAVSSPAPTEYVKISGSNFVVDTLNGIPAYYNQYNRSWQCVEYMQRYYRELFGVEMNIGYSEPYIVSGEGSFKKAECPRVGDVVYWPAYLRNVNYGHVAIVKDYDDGVITLIEQNWCYNGKAAIDRQVSWPSKEFYVFTLTGEKADKIRGEQLGIWDLTTEHESVDLVSPWATEYVDGNAEQKLFSTDGIKSYTDPITRLAFCTMNAELLKNLKPDVEVEAPDISALAATLSAYELISREEAAQIIANDDELSKLVPYELNSASILGQYKDAGKVSPEARDAMALLVHLGVFAGTGNGKLNPGSYATGEQAVTWLMRTYAVLRGSAY